MVSAAKLKRATDAISGNASLCNKLKDILDNVSANLGDATYRLLKSSGRN